MSEENNKIEEQESVEPQTATDAKTAPGVAAEQQRAFFTRRRIGFSLGFLALILLLLSFSGVVLYRTGYFDNYIKAQFVAKMSDIGVDFSADVFQVRVAPLRLELKNATFNDRVSGDKLFFVRQAELNLTVTNLYAWQLSRDISVDTTDVDGIEAWVKFDENGKSNFSNLNLVQDEAGSRVNFKYTSAKFSLKNGIVHFGDAEHKIDADARNILFLLEPLDASVPDEQKRFRFDLTSTDSNLVYDEKSAVENIDVRARGIADGYGAEISEFKLTSPLGESTLSGKLTDWERLLYDLNVDSTVDLTQTSTVFPLGTAIRGVGNFSGRVTGEGAKYRVEGNIQSDALAASNIRLKGLKIDATVAGENTMYEANGKAVAELLTFEDFKIDFLQATGNIRGTGTDFKWFGELQAAAAKSPLGTIAGLYITDAAAEYKDSQFIANLGNLRAGNFNSPDASAQSLQAQNIRIFNDGDRTEFSAPSLRAGALNVGTSAKLKGVVVGNLKATKRGDETNVTASNLQANSLEAAGATIQGVNAGDVKLKNRGSRTDVNAANLRAQNIQTKDARLKNLTAKNLTAQRQNGSTNVQVGSAQADGFHIGGGNGGVDFGAIDANGVDIKDRDGGATEVYADNLRTAKIETSAAILGSVNVAGVRLTLLRGRIEARAGSEVNVGDVALTKNTLPDGGDLQAVKLNKPVFVLEPSGHYRASADMSLGGGVLGSVRLGAARAQVVAENEQVAFNNLTADVMDGAINGDAVIALNDRRQSRVDAAFSNLDLSKLLALQGGRVVPVEGKTTGNANLTFAGTNIKTVSGTVTADFAANAGTQERGLVPVNGKLGLRATNGLFNIDYANLNTEKSAFDATGQFDLSGANSNLNLALNSSDASEIERIIRVLNVSPELEARLDSYEAAFAGNFNFNGKLTGNLSDPTIDGRASVDSLILRGRNLGSVATNLLASSAGFELRDGVLREPNGGGNLAFSVNVPSGSGANNISVNAKLNDINTGNILAALPVGFLPAQFQDFDARTSGSVNVSGIPNDLQGEANISSGKGTIKGQPFDGFDLKATFAGTLVNLENFRARFGSGFLAATGTYRTDVGDFNLNVEGKNIDVARVRPFIPNEASLPAIAGTLDLTAKATGAGTDFKTYDINFSGVGRGIVLSDNGIGDVSFNGTTQNQQLNANITANFQGQPQAIAASVNFADPNLPFRAETIFNNTELAPFIALVRPTDEVSITGQATGRVFVEGNLYGIDKTTGKPGFTTDNLRGAASFNQFGLQIGETQLVASEPVAVEFDAKEIRVQNAKFSGSGTNLVVSGVKALTDDGYNNLAINGRINLSVFNALSKNTFAAGFADVSVSLKGVNRTAQLGGMANLQNAAVSTFIGSERIALDRVNGGIRFSSNQAQIDNLTGFLGGGKITASGGASVEGLQLQAFRLNIRGSNITAPVPPGFITTGDANIEFSGVRTGRIMNSLIAGDFTARRSVYTKDIDIADFVSGRREGSLTASSSANTASTDSFVGTPNLDIRIEGRDALVVRNNIADLTASASLRVTGDTEFPIISGRVTAESGTILFRKERYEVQRAVIEFPPNSSNSPFVNVQAETEIKGYQIFVNLVGDVSDTENLNATVRSNPNLPQADVISLITTGNLSNSDTGIPTLASSGINTAAEILTDELINNPLSRATDKLFGLNRFEIDPIVSGERLNPSARLTVGRQINRNLLITYSTNLSGDQNQVLALEYRVSNRLSFVAQYEQRSLSNVTRNNNNFNFEIRLRKRF